MEHAEDTGFYCFRAVESLRQFFKEDEDGDDDCPSWKKLRGAIGVKRETIEDDIQAYGSDRRHGDVFSITEEEGKLVLETTWDIIRRFIEFASEELGPRYTEEQE